MLKLFNWRGYSSFLGSIAEISINFIVSNPHPIPQSYNRNKATHCQILI